MKDPERFADRPPSALAQSLLAGALEEEPPRSLFEQTLIAANAGAKASGAVASTSAATGVSGALVKYLGLGAIAGALATGAAFELGGAPSPAGSAVSVAASQAVKSAPVPEAPVAGGEPAKAADPDRPVSVAELPPLGAAPASQPTASHEAFVEPDRGKSLREEALWIDRAREAVTRGNADRALRMLDDYGARFKKPAFHPEALYLRMQALRLSGDERSAQRLARQLLSAYPNGAQAASARAFLKASDP